MISGTRSVRRLPAWVVAGVLLSGCAFFEQPERSLLEACVGDGSAMIEGSAGGLVPVLAGEWVMWLVSVPAGSWARDPSDVVGSNLVTGEREVIRAGGGTVALGPMKGGRVAWIQATPEGEQALEWYDPVTRRYGQAIVAGGSAVSVGFFGDDFIYNIGYPGEVRRRNLTTSEEEVVFVGDENLSLGGVALDGDRMAISRAGPAGGSLDVLNLTTGTMQHVFSAPGMGQVKIEGDFVTFSVSPIPTVPSEVRGVFLANLTTGAVWEAGPSGEPWPKNAQEPRLSFPWLAYRQSDFGIGVVHIPSNETFEAVNFLRDQPKFLDMSGGRIVYNTKRDAGGIVLRCLRPPG